jgi:phosphatidylglycerol:prolipoprotein diacylglycerol transferase
MYHFASVNPVAIENFFGRPIHWYGIIISIGVMLGIYLAMRNARYYGVDPEKIVDFALLAIPMAIIGARLYYVIFAWEHYKNNLIDIVKIWEGGLAIFGGVLAGILAGLIFSRWRKINFWLLADLCIPSMILGQAIGRWGNFFNQEAYGIEIINKAWQWFPAAVYIDANQAWHMATFFYESVWNFAVFFFLMYFRKKRKVNGELFLLYLILYSSGRFVIEGLRTDSLTWGSFVSPAQNSFFFQNGGFRVSQILSLVLIALGIALFVLRRKKAALGTLPEGDVTLIIAPDAAFDAEQAEKAECEGQPGGEEHPEVEEQLIEDGQPEREEHPTDEGQVQAVDKEHSVDEERFTDVGQPADAEPPVGEAHPTEAEQPIEGEQPADEDQPVDNDQPSDE